MINEDLYKRFLSSIEAELSFCDSEKTPLVCANFSNSSYKDSLIETIAETCISRKINISSAIVEVEKLYSINSFISGVYFIS